MDEPSGELISSLVLLLRLILTFPSSSMRWPLLASIHSSATTILRRPSMRLSVQLSLRASTSASAWRNEYRGRLMPTLGIIATSRCVTPSDSRARS